MVIFGPFLAEIAYLRDYVPLNVGFGANFIPYTKGLNTRDILRKFWTVRVWSLGPGGSRRGPKWSFLGHF